MTVGEFFAKAQANWGKFEGNPDEVFGIWSGALRDIQPNKLAAAFDYLVRNSKYRPKPADVFDALEKIGMTAEKPKKEGVNTGAMLDYAAQRQVEMLDDWKRRNPELWREAEAGRWDLPLEGEGRNRAHLLGQFEYLAQHHGWQDKAAAFWEIRPEEIRDQHRSELQLSFTAAQLDSLRKLGAEIRKKPEPVYGFRSIGALTREDA